MLAFAVRLLGRPRDVFAVLVSNFPVHFKIAGDVAVM